MKNTKNIGLAVLLCSTLLMAPRIGFANHHHQHQGCGQSCEHQKNDHGCKSCGQCNGHHGFDDHGNYFLDFAGQDNLALTEKQQATLNEIRIKTDKEVRQMREQLKGAHEELMKASHEEKAGKKSLEKITKKIGELHGQTVLAQTLSLIDAKRVLTEEQRKKVWSTHAGEVKNAGMPACCQSGQCDAKPEFEQKPKK